MSQQPSRVTPELVLPTPKGKAQATKVGAEQETRQEAMQASTVLSREDAVVEGPPLRQGKVSLNFRLDPVLHQRLRSVSHRTDVSIQLIVETAVRHYLDTMAP